MNNLTIESQDLIKGIKHFTKNNAPHLTEYHCELIFNKILSQNLSEKEIENLIKHINRDVKGNTLNSIDGFILNSSSLNNLINKQLYKYELSIIFKDFFNLIQSNGIIDKTNLVNFFKLCNINMSHESLVCLSQLSLDLENFSKKIDYKTFLNLIELYLSKNSII